MMGNGKEESVAQSRVAVIREIARWGEVLGGCHCGDITSSIANSSTRLGSLGGISLRFMADIFCASGACSMIFLLFARELNVISIFPEGRVRYTRGLWPLNQLALYPDLIVFLALSLAPLKLLEL